jgi:hypothetical protein
LVGYVLQPQVLGEQFLHSRAVAEVPLMLKNVTNLVLAVSWARGRSRGAPLDVELLVLVHPPVQREPLDHGTLFALRVQGLRR